MLGNKYQIPFVKETARKELAKSLNPSNVASTARIALLYEDDHLLEPSLNVLLDNFDNIEGTPGWDQIEKDHQLTLLAKLFARMKMRKNAKYAFQWND